MLKQEPLLARLLRYALYLSAFVPLIIFSQFISPFHFGKVVVFRSIVEIMLIGYLLLIWRDRSYLPRTNPIFWAFLIFAAAFTLTTITSVQSYVSFWGSLERMGGLWTFWHYFVFYVIATAVMRKQEYWETFLKLTVLNALLSAFYGFGQKTDISFFVGSGGRERIFGTIGNAALFAGYQIVGIFLALTFLIRPGNSSRDTVLYTSQVGFGSLAVVMTVVRGSLMGLGAGFLLFSLWHFLSTGSKKSKLAFLSMMTLVGIAAIVILTPIKESSFIRGSRFLTRLSDTSFSATTAKTRFWAWEAGLKGWRESPQKILVGWGPENFNIPFSKYFNPKFFTGYGAETLFDRAHNMFVEVLVTMGIIGLAAYLSLYYASVRTLQKIKTRNPANISYTIGFTSLILAYAIHNSFIFDTSANFLVFFSVLAFISFLYLKEEQKDLPGTSAPARIKQPFYVVVGSVLIIMVSVLVYKTNIIPSKANYTSTRGIIAGWDGNFSAAVGKFKEAMSYDAPGKYEIRHRFAQYVLEYASSKKITPEIESALKFAIEEVTKNRDENPADYLPELYLSRLNINLGRDNPESEYNERALQHSLKALEISPTFIRTFYEIGQAYLNKKDYDNAIKYFKQAAELNPEVGLSYWYWGIVELTRGNTEEGLKAVNLALERGYTPTEQEYLSLGNLYLAKKDYVRLAKVYEALIRLNPKNPMHYVSLAVVYGNLGRIDEAVEMARKAVLIDPTYLPQAQEFARQLGREL